MATRKQIEANRKNARKSTGPRTREGKQVSRLNALTHGLTAAEVLLPHEDRARYEALCAALVADFQPETAMESLVVERIAVGMWRLRRACAFEAALIGHHRQVAQLHFYKESQEGTLPEARLIDPAPIEFVEPDDLDEDELTDDERNYLRAKEQYLANPPFDALAFIRSTMGADILGKLTRYERTIRRNLMEDLDQLEQLIQKRRRADEA